MAKTAVKQSSRMDFSSEIEKTMNPSMIELDKQKAVPSDKDSSSTNIDKSNKPKKIKEKKPAGRPSNGPTKKISLSIPEDMYESVEIAASLRTKGNITAYINFLIKQDLELNKTKYQEFDKLSLS